VERWVKWIRLEQIEILVCQPARFFGLLMIKLPEAGQSAMIRNAEFIPQPKGDTKACLELAG